jgi:hypothetical protein
MAACDARVKQPKVTIYGTYVKLLFLQFLGARSSASAAAVSLEGLRPNKVLASAKPWAEIDARLGCRVAMLDVVWPIG